MKVGVVGADAFLVVKYILPHTAALCGGRVKDIPAMSMSALSPLSPDGCTRGLKALQRGGLAPDAIASITIVEGSHVDDPILDAISESCDVVILVMPPGTATAEMARALDYLLSRQVHVITPDITPPATDVHETSSLALVESCINSAAGDAVGPRGKWNVLTPWLFLSQYRRFRQTCEAALLTQGAYRSYTFDMNVPVGPDTVMEHCMHAMHLLRDLFGDVDMIQCKSNEVLPESALRLESTHAIAANVGNLVGTLSLDARSTTTTHPIGKLAVEFESGHCESWEMGKSALSTTALQVTYGQALNDAFRSISNCKRSRGIQPSSSWGISSVRVYQICFAALESHVSGQLIRVKPPLCLLEPCSLMKFPNRSLTTTRSFHSVIRCSCVREIQAAVSWYAESCQILDFAEWGVFVVGAENSLRQYSATNRSQGLRIELLHMNRLISFSPPQDSFSYGIVRVQSSMSLRRLVELLAAVDCMLTSLPILLDQTIGGCVSTGSHGSSLVHGTVSDFVCGATVISRSGEMMEFVDDRCRALKCCEKSLGLSSSLGEEISRTDEGSLRAIRCGVGELGVLCDISLLVVPRIYLRREEIVIVFSGSCIQDKCERVASELVCVGRRVEHLWAMWKLGADSLMCMCLHKCEEDKISQPGVSVANGRNWHPFSNDLISYLDDPASVTSEKAKCLCYTLQYSFPLYQLTEVLVELNRLIDTYEGRVIEFKFLAPSKRTILAPNSIEADMTGASITGGFVCVNVWWEVEDASILQEIESILRDKLNGRSHYGKWHAGFGVGAGNVNPWIEFRNVCHESFC